MYDSPIIHTWSEGPGGSTRIGVKVCTEERPMIYDLRKHRRRSVRLKEYDYSKEGAYFVTICTCDRVPLFDNEAVRDVAERCWLGIPNHFPTVQTDEWVVMPNHLHGILCIIGRGVQLNAPTEAVRNANDRFSVISPRRGELSTIVRTYKAVVTTLCRKGGHTHFAWQRGYYEHVIRSEDELNRARQYIVDNRLQLEVSGDRPYWLMVE